MRPGQPSRRDFIKTVATGVGAGALLPWLAGAGTPTRRPNVILALSDQHRWQSMSFTETPQVQTPELERMAREGFSASNCLANYPLCSPARAMLLTGRWPWETGVTDNRTRTEFNLAPTTTTLGSVFSAAGYDTGYVGKWHVGRESEGLASFGFQHSRLWTHTSDHMNSRYLTPDGKRHKSKRYNASHMTDQLIEFISQDRDRPFFGVISWNIPHANYLDAPPELLALYADHAGLPLRENWAPSAGSNDAKRAQSVAFYWGYHAHVTALDTELARIRRRLEELGASEDTLILYLSDHGGMLFSHGMLGKRVAYAESLKVPCIAVWPGSIPAGSSSDAPLSLLDVFPSLCALAGVAVPEGRSGMDLSSLFLGRPGTTPNAQLIMNLAAKPPRTKALGEPAAEIYRGVATRRHTYTVTPEGPSLLFDNAEDPLQLTNRIGDPSLAATRKRLHALLVEKLRTSRDPFQLPR